MKNNLSLGLEKAKNYCFLLLKFRLRSEHELLERLKNKKFDQETSEKAVSFLKEKGFIDDKAFAKIWIQSRLKKPLGLRRLTQELRVKGINKEIIENQIENIKHNYSEEEVIGEIVKKKLSKTKNIDPQKAKERIYGYLLRRGFSPDVVIDVLSQWQR